MTSDIGRREKYRWQYFEGKCVIFPLHILNSYVVSLLHLLPYAGPICFRSYIVFCNAILVIPLSDPDKYWYKNNEILCQIESSYFDSNGFWMRYTNDAEKLNRVKYIGNYKKLIALKCVFVFHFLSEQCQCNLVKTNGRTARLVWTSLLLLKQSSAF